MAQKVTIVMHDENIHNVACRLRRLNTILSSDEKSYASDCYRELYHNENFNALIAPNKATTHINFEFSFLQTIPELTVQILEYIALLLYKRIYFKKGKDYSISFKLTSYNKRFFDINSFLLYGSCDKRID